MPLCRKTLNPLAVANLRKLSFIPNHFTKIKTVKKLNINLIEYWINYNLNSRYAIRKNFVLDDKSKIIEVLEIGLEDPKEISILTLGCPYLHE